MTEEQVDEIRDGYEASSLSARDVVALRFTDALLRDPRRARQLQAELRAHFSGPEIVELAFGVVIFHALSKLLITLGLEPEQMPRTVLPTPGA